MKYLTAEQVAEILQVTASWVHDRVREGQIPFEPMPGCRYVRFIDVVVYAWMANGMRPLSKAERAEIINSKHQVMFEPAPSTPRKKRKFTAASRQKMSESMKARWARRKEQTQNATRKHFQDEEVLVRKVV